MAPLAFSGVEIFGIVVGGLAGVGTVARVLLSIVHERRRSQPIVINHAVDGPMAMGLEEAATGYWSELRNEGGGPAFNVRFGIKWGRVRFPYTRNPQDPSSGSRQRVIASGTRLPAEGDSFVVLIPWQAFGIGVVDEDARVYWARYENASGLTWETLNPVNEAAHMEIRRVRCLRLRERLETRRRRLVLEQGTTGLLADLRYMRAHRGTDPPPAEADDSSA